MDFVATTQIRSSTLVGLWSQMQADGWVLDLIQTAFAASLGIADTDFTLANFVGYVAAVGAAAPFVIFENELAGSFDFECEPAEPGGHVEVAGAIVAPQTIFGYCLHDGITTDLLATAAFPAPITVSRTGAGVAFPLHWLSFLGNFMV